MQAMLTACILITEASFVASLKYPSRNKPLLLLHALCNKIREWEPRGCLGTPFKTSFREESTPNSACSWKHLSQHCLAPAHPSRCSLALNEMQKKSVQPKQHGSPLVEYRSVCKPYLPTWHCQAQWTLPGYQREREIVSLVHSASIGL